MATAAKTPAVKLPKTLAGCADSLYETQQTRYRLQKELDAMKEYEGLLREHLIENLPKSDATGVAGKVARATVKTDTVYSPTDWEAVHTYILANAKKNPGVWSIMQKRLGGEAVKELDEAGKLPKGIERIQVPKISLSKV